MNHIVDKLNIVLIALSAILAFIFPLELFIFTYAVIGPLHYVTEINWLHNKNYFFSNQNWIWLLIGVVASLILFVPKLYLEYGDVNSTLGKILTLINSWSNSVIFISILLAIGYQFIRSKIGWIVISIIGILGSVFLKEMEYYNFLIGLFVPTIIHVYIFTLIFMLYGAKKSKSFFGYIGVLTAMVVPLIFIFIQIQPEQYLFNDSLKELYLDNNFHITPVILSKYLGLSDGTTFYFYESIELKLMMFLSFIYCYHYLNWFSKTTVIKWHKLLNLKKIIAIVTIWGVILILYYIDFKLGFLVSLFFSFLHVILEFPLNFMSIKEIFISRK